MELVEADEVPRAAAWWALSRPRMLPYVLMLPLSGYGWAHWDRALEARNPELLGLVLLSWTFLHAGTLWLNAAVDRDEGEVLMGRSVPPPPGTSALGYGALVGTVLLAIPAGPVVALAAAACAVLAVLYSHPAVMWKGHALGGPFVNLVGYGLLSPMVGYAVVGVPVTPRSLAVWALVAFGILGTYFAAQAFQQQEDADRGYRTLVATHGSRAVIRAARTCIGLAMGGGLLLAAIGWLPRGCLLVAPGWWVLDRWMVQWLAQPHGGDASWALGFTRRLLWAGLIGLGAASVDYVRASFSDQPVAGLGTQRGHPSDRPRLAPREMRLWEAAHGGALVPSDPASSTVREEPR